MGFVSDFLLLLALWISAPTHAWYKRWWSSAKFLYAHGSTRAARATSWWEAWRRGSSPAATAAYAYDATTGDLFLIFIFNMHYQGLFNRRA